MVLYGTQHIHGEDVREFEIVECDHHKESERESCDHPILEQRVIVCSLPEKEEEEEHKCEEEDRTWPLEIGSVEEEIERRDDIERHLVEWQILHAHVRAGRCLLVGDLRQELDRSDGD